MSETEWYYRKGNKRFGPVSAADLKRLGGAGVLGRDDLVWRDGLEEWVAAGRVKGVFTDPSMVANTRTGAPMDAIPPAAAPVDVTHPPKCDDLDEIGGPDEYEELEGDEESTPPQHILDHLMNNVRPMLDVVGGDSVGGTFVQIGKFAIYLALVFGLAFTFYQAVKSDRLSVIFDGVAWALLTLVLQYTAVRMSCAIESLIAGTPTRLSSTAFVDSFAMLSIATSIIILGYGLLLGAQTSQLAWAMGGVVFAVVGLYIAMLAINYKSLNIHIADDVSAGEEGVGVITFLIVLVMRIVPMLFGIGCTMATLGLAADFYLYVREAEPLAFGPGGITGKGGPLTYLLPLGPDAWMGVIARLASLPLVAYLLFIFYYIALDVVRSILILPGKVDKLSRND